MSLQPIAQQWARVRGTLALCVAVIGGAFGMAAIAAAAGGEAMHVFTMDPTALLGAPPYSGAISTLGIMLWTAAATAALLGALVLRRLADHNWRYRHLIATGLLTAVFLFDDAYLVHEDLIPRFLGLPELAVLASYALLLLTYLIVWRAAVARSEYLLLATALALWGVSAGIDALNALEIVRHASALEDTFKFSGIVVWAAYSIRLAAAAIGGATAGEPDPLRLGRRQRVKSGA